MRCLFIILLGFSAFLVSGQNVVFEDKETNKKFNQKQKDFQPNKIIGLEDGNLLGYYSKSKGGKLKSEYIVKVFDENLNLIDAVESELPKKTYVNSLYGFQDGRIVAFVYEEKGGRKIELAVVPLNVSKKSLDFTQKSIIGTYEMAKGRSARNAMKSGSLFNFITNDSGNYVALVGSEESRRSKDREINFVIINSQGKIAAAETYNFQEDTKNIIVHNYAISSDGQLFAVYTDIRSGKRKGGESYTINLLKGERNRVGDDVQSLNDPYIQTRSDGQGILLLSTYSESKKDNIKGRAQGIYLAFLDKNAVLTNDLYKPFPKVVLSDIFDGKKSKIKKGNVSTDFDVRFLRENDRGYFNFVIEPHFRIYSYDQNGNVQSITYHSWSAICGEVNPEKSDFNWIEVVKKEEKVKSLDAVGSFVYLDKEDRLNVIFNYNKEEKGSKNSPGVKYNNKNPRSSTIKQVVFTTEGGREDLDLVKSKKETGMYFIPKLCQWDAQKHRSSLILMKRNREMVGLIQD